MSIKSSCLGFPRIGSNREFKKALEAYWTGKTPATELQKVAMNLRQDHWRRMHGAGIDHVPSGDFSLYDHVLDTAVMFDVIPPRYRGISDPLDQYFAMARGMQSSDGITDVAALEMTKWFDTNYHFIVPELESSQVFKLDSSSLLKNFQEAKDLGIETRPVILGPITFLLLSKLSNGDSPAAKLNFLDQLVPLYLNLFSQLAAVGATWIQVDEPCLVLDLDDATVQAYKKFLPQLTGSKDRPKLLLTNYFGPLSDNLHLAFNSGFDGVHIDLVRAPEQLGPALDALKSDTILSLGLVDGRNIWRTDLDQASSLVKKAVQQIGPERLIIAPSCSLLHSPVDLGEETKIDEELRAWLAFAVQKLGEIKALSRGEDSSPDVKSIYYRNRMALKTRRESPRTRNKSVRDRCADITLPMIQRTSNYSARATVQKSRFKLPLFPTTTIGSFPQTKDIRAARAAWKAGKLSQHDYDEFLREETESCIARQEALGLDVLVHGEFERTDMVEYFGEKLDGFAFTGNGWVQSYGSRCVKPPVIFGDVSRPLPMTVNWSKYAQSLSALPVKGMLTGPVTILQWSFVRDDQPRWKTCQQIALALRDEISDLEKSGINMIQVDEPAIREGLPLRKADWPAYLKWAVDAFRLSTSGVHDETQIHTHMCYSEFGDILDAIAAMDADVLSIETSRSHKELLEDFAKYSYPNEVGLGVYDIHSPRIPTKGEMVDVLTNAAALIPLERLWVNPDCGLKTRGWEEVEAALTVMVSAARTMRESTKIT